MSLPQRPQTRSAESATASSGSRALTTQEGRGRDCGCLSSEQVASMPDQRLLGVHHRGLSQKWGSMTGAGRRSDRTKLS